MAVADLKVISHTSLHRDQDLNHQKCFKEQLLTLDGDPGGMCNILWVLNTVGTFGGYVDKGYDTLGHKDLRKLHVKLFKINWMLLNN